MYQQKLNPREGVEVGSSDKLSHLFLTTTHVGRFGICFFCVDLLDLEFPTLVVNVEVVSSPKFHGQMIFFESLGGCQSG
jgi:hypothetical protein